MNLDEFNELVKKREDIENELKVHMDFLESPENKNVGMKGNLIDSEGFPRNDIDIYSIRVARNKIICLKNDYIDINKKLEEYIHKVHSTHPVIRVERNKNINNDLLNTPQQITKEEDIQNAKKNIFAIIDEVIDNSPSHKSGLKINDQIFQFGDIIKKNENEQNNYSNIQLIKEIGNYMKTQPKQILVKILREENILFYHIIPEQTQKGLYIGCHISPYDSS
ncbi:proteasome regulatory protein, putative [Plasmodium sp. gorilla clade G2]|uniref:proteasome regulatory protein, putative n=1 Tax=Plasmodium sp. gorilla clade G2 TaxID=880535 RepID=UPI000D221D48|nr:proteasome regulatory protein, putative [Plasmodium sp. gorilla clade G2]SOV10960.1 proteasome regulatory protein, putative [Plasmodium sp. gorilla clade G2]